MKTDEVELDAQRLATEWAFIRAVETIDKTDYTIKMRLHVGPDCFVQIYVNVDKQLVNYALLLHRARIFGRDCDGGSWHRHPARSPDQHDVSPEGQRAVSLSEFLEEALQVLQNQNLA